jgi:hypothetical protein
MSNSKRITIAGAAFLGILVLLVLLFRSGQEKIDWRELYTEDNRQPYGTHVVFELLKSYFPGRQVRMLKDSLRGELPQQSENSSYLFVGEALYMDSLDLRDLLHFVEAGNTAFISSKTIPFDLMFHVYYDECEGAYWEDYDSYVDTIAYMSFEHPALKRDKGYSYQYLYNNEVKAYSWSYISSYYFCGMEAGLTPIGNLNDTLVNFVRRKMGEGYIYLHTNPIVFSNIQLLDKQGLSYVNGLLSHLPEGDVYWDAYSRVPEWLGRRRNDDYNYGYNRSLSSDSPLQYILSQPPLAWAWYLLLLTGLLYLIFRAKRKQRVIPVLEPNTNTSMEFITTIGRLYFLQNNHKRLAIQQMKLWLAYLREHYLLNTRELDGEFVEKLVAKSETQKALVEQILLLHKNIENSSFVSENTLMEFHQRLDEFYKSCK